MQPVVFQVINKRLEYTFYVNYKPDKLSATRHYMSNGQIIF